jgi:DNA-nicking Smr family endonuclease
MPKKDASKGPSSKATSAKATSAKATSAKAASAKAAGSKATKGSPFAALAEAVKARKVAAARELVQAKGKASTKVAEAAKAATSPAEKPSTAKGGAPKTSKEPSAREALAPEGARVLPADGGPLAAYPYEDRVAFHDAFGDVRPLGAPAGPRDKVKKTKASGVRGPRAVAERAHRDAAEEAARARLERLVVEGVSFQVRRDEHGVEAKRKGAADRTILLLLRGELTPEARVDLHGLTRADAMKVVRQFVRDAKSKSRLTLLIIHGKGAHSEGGIGVLEEACVEALTKGGAAPYVEAFATAPTRFGGRGAIVVRLRSR